MKKIWVIIKKEFARVFKDRRLVIMLFLPGILVYAIYSLLGGVINNSAEEPQKYSFYAVNMPEIFAEGFENLNFVLETDESDGEKIKEKIKSGDAELYMIFPETMPTEPAAGIAPSIEIYYNSTESDSSAAYAAAVSFLNAYESLIANVFDVNAGDGKYDLADERDMTGMMFSMIMPMLLTVFVFTGAISYVPESIAGEKERGSIATLLVTPIKRGYLALGKILSLVGISLISGISSFIGTVLSLPKLVGGAGVDLDAGAYMFKDYLMLFFIVIAAVFLVVSIVSVISAFSKSVKEATAYVSPLMILVMLVGFTGLFGEGTAQSPFLYLIPFYNNVQAIGAIFSFAASPLNVAIAIISNLVYSILLSLLLAKMFSSEKIMFRK